MALRSFPCRNAIEHPAGLAELTPSVFAPIVPERAAGRRADGLDGGGRDMGGARVGLRAGRRPLSARWRRFRTEEASQRSLLQPRSKSCDRLAWYKHNSLTRSVMQLGSTMPNELAQQLSIRLSPSPGLRGSGAVPRPPSAPPTLLILNRHDLPTRPLLQRLAPPPPLNFAHARRLVLPVHAQHERLGVGVDLDPARLLQLLPVAVV